MESKFLLALIGVILLSTLSNQASLGENNKFEPESILEILNALDKSKIIEIGNRIQEKENNGGIKNVDFAKLLSSLDDNSVITENKDTEILKPSNKKFSFQSVIQQASNVLNNIKEESSSSLNTNSNSLSSLSNSALNIPLPVLTNIQSGLESVRNLTDLSSSQINNLINSNANGNLVQTNSDAPLKPNNINNPNSLGLDQISNIIKDLSTNDQSSRNKLNGLLQFLARDASNNSTIISTEPNINDLVSNLTNNDPQLSSLLTNLPNIISNLNIDPNQLVNIISSLQVQDQSQLTNGILNVLANQTNVNLNDIQNQYNTINNLANNFQNLNTSNLMVLFNNIQNLDQQNTSLINVYIDMVSNQTGLNRDQIKSILILINRLANLGMNAKPEQIVGIFLDFLKANPDISMTLFNFIGAQTNIAPSQVQNLVLYLPAIVDAVTSMNLTQLANLFLNFAASQNNFPQDSLQPIINTLFQISDAITKMDLSRLVKIICDLLTQNQSVNSLIASQFNIPPQQLQNTFGFLCQIFDSFQSVNTSSIDQNQIQQLVQQFLSQNPDILNQFFGTVSSQTGLGPDQVQAIMGQLSQLASLFTNNFINNTGNPIEFLNALGFFNYTGLSPDQFQSILGAAAQLFNTNNITPQQLYDLLANYKLNNQTLLSIFIGYLGSQTNLSPNQIQNLIFTLPPFLNAVSNSNSSQILTLLTYLLYQSMPAPLNLDPNQIQNLLVPYSQLISAASQMSPDQLINYISDPNVTLSRDVAQQLKMLIQSLSPEVYNSLNVQNETDVKKLIAILVTESEKKINQQLSMLGIPINNQPLGPNLNAVDPNLLAKINDLAQSNLGQILPSSSPLPKQPANINLI